MRTSRLLLLAALILAAWLFVVYELQTVSWAPPTPAGSVRRGDALSAGLSSAVPSRVATSPATRGGTAHTSRGLQRLDWDALAMCESSGNPHKVNGSGRYRGLYQFDRATWRSVGGTGDPAAATTAEQTRRAQLLYARRGAQPWPECGRRLR